MAIIEINTYAQEKATGRIGLVTERDGNGVTLAFYDRCCRKPEYVTLSDELLQPAEVPEMKMSRLGPFVRGELSLAEVSGGVNLLSFVLDEDAEDYRLTPEDLLQGIRAYEAAAPDELYAWLDGLLQFEDEIFSVEEYDEDSFISSLVYSWYHRAFENVWSELREDADDDSYEYDPTEGMETLKEELEEWIASGCKDIPVTLKIEMAARYDEDSIDHQTPELQRIFKQSLDYCCDVIGLPKMIQKRGYCYYTGTKVYPNDWNKARDAFLTYYQMTGDALAANTLGYIFYYGRCNGGVPEYEKAFYYFTIGHAYSYYESTYKLADMLAKGYGVVKDGESANHLYWSVYEQNLPRFQEGELTGKFADAALRVGNCYYYGYGVPKDYESAYAYYLQADYAIRQRMARGDQYGDASVFSGIQQALAKTREKYTEKGRSQSFCYPGWTRWCLLDNRRCRLTLTPGENGTLTLSASPMKRRTEHKTPQMLITLPRADYCELTDRLELTMAPGTGWHSATGLPEIVFDSFEYDHEEKKTTFYLYDDPVGEIITEEYIFTAPEVRKAEPAGPSHHFVSICFQPHSRCYDYLCDDSTVEVGDYVLVPGYDGETEVAVVAVFDKQESELPLPIAKYKKVIEKVFMPE